jgi:co-chaperonin GroES (HSP10)
MNDLMRRKASGGAPTGDIENFGKVGDVFLHEVPELADCDVGIEEVVEYNLIIAPAVMPGKIGRILIADETRETLGLARQVGRIVLQSEIAFNYDAWPKDGNGPPRVGDIVWFARYAGGIITGRDGKDYRIIKDKDVGAIISRAPRSDSPRPVKALPVHDFDDFAHPCGRCGARREEWEDNLAPICDRADVEAMRAREGFE